MRRDAGSAARTLSRPIAPPDAGGRQGFIPDAPRLARTDSCCARSHAQSTLRCAGKVAHPRSVGDCTVRRDGDNGHAPGKLRASARRNSPQAQPALRCGYRRATGSRWHGMGQHCVHSSGRRNVRRQQPSSLGRPPACISTTCLFRRKARKREVCGAAVAGSLAGPGQAGTLHRLLAAMGDFAHADRRRRVAPVSTRVERV